MDFYEFRSRKDVRVGEKIERLTHEVIGAAIEVHRVLGPGLPESHYRNALWHELALRGIPHQPEAPFDVMYKGLCVGTGRLDVLVADRLILELKAVDCLDDTHMSQAITYLVSMDLPLALLINFNVRFVKDGIRRVLDTPLV